MGIEIMPAEINGPLFINCSWLWIRPGKMHIFQKCHRMISLKNIEQRYTAPWVDRGEESPISLLYGWLPAHISNNLDN